MSRSISNSHQAVRSVGLLDAVKGRIREKSAGGEASGARRVRGGIQNSLRRGATALLFVSVVLTPLAAAQSGGVTGGTVTEEGTGSATGGEATGGATGGAQGAATLTLAEAVDAGLSVDADVVSAQADLAAAERDQARTEADPLSLRLPRVRAAQGVVAAQDALEASRLAAQNAVANAYYAALEADTTLELAQQQQAIAETTLQAQQIRLQAGAATQLDVDRAQNALSSAQRNTADAQQARNLAYSDLASQIGGSAEGLVLQPDQDAAPEVPTLDSVLARLDDNAQLRAASQAVDLAQVSLEAVDNAFSPQADIETARDTLSNATTRLQEARRSLELAVQSSYNAVVAAQSRLESAQADLATSEATLEAQEVRFQAGSISRVDIEQARLDQANTVASAAVARHNLAKALLQLQQTVQGSAQGAG